MAEVFDSFGPPPPTLPPSTKVRRWDTALFAGAFGFTAALLGVGWVLWRPLPGSPVCPDGGLLSQLIAYPHLLMSFGHADINAWADNPASEQVGVSIASLHVRLLPAWIAGLFAGGGGMWVGLKPHGLTGHVSGPQLLEDGEAKRAALRVASVERDGKKTGWMKLHPLLDLSRRQFTKHILMYGGVGAGKTQIFLYLISQIMAKQQKALILDTKGDYTSRFPQAMILSPWDRRSRYLDIAADVRNGSQAAAFAASVIPDEPGPNRFFTVSAQLILTGCIRALQTMRGTVWTWADLDALLTLSAKQLAPLLAEHYRKAHPMVTGADGSTASVMATLSAFTQIITDMSESMGDGLRSDGSPRKRLSLVAWAKDDYVGKKAIILQAGPDAGLSQRYIAAVINILVPEIISPALPDDTSTDGRAIWIMLDELPAAGRINLSPLAALGRSKGVCLCLGLQDQNQLAAIHGEPFSKALASMVGTHIVAAMSMGETREHVASMIGSRRVSIQTAATATGAGSVHEEQRQLVQPSDLTTKLGFRRGKKYGPNGFGIRALVNLGGDDLMILDWPGIVLPELRPAFVPAKWTLPRTAPMTGAPAIGGDQPSQTIEQTVDPALLAQVIDEVTPQL